VPGLFFLSEIIIFFVTAWYEIILKLYTVLSKFIQNIIDKEVNILSEPA
jgi:hypothetical protein